VSDPKHWDAVYDSKSPDAVSWYAPTLALSLGLVKGLGLPPTARIVDVGGGASTLADDLLGLGFARPTVLDISHFALEAAQERMGDEAERVDWIVGDVTSVDLPAHQFDVWHDRAVFHFLTEAGDRRRYVDAVRRALKPGGHVIIATFGPDGPQKCSGLNVVRYSESDLHSEFGGEFEKLGCTTETHHTPWGGDQEFLYCLCRMGDDGALIQHRRLNTRRKVRSRPTNKTVTAA
jgi:SAM-dependent methyltransferase